MGSRGTECLKRVKALVNAGCDPLACNLADETPFHTAAVAEHISVMEYLLSLGVPVPSDILLTQFETTCYSTLLPQLSTILFLMDNGGDVHTVATNGNTLLHLAAMLHPEQDALELAKQLVHAGCIPCALNSLQKNPLHIAAQCGFTSVIEYFLSLNIALPPDILLAASSGFSKKAQLICFLLQEGASASVATTDGDTPLHLLLTASEDSDSKDDDLECVKILIDAGCDLRARNSAGETPLHIMARGGSSDILEYLFSRDVPLPHDILLASSATTIRFLLSNGLDLRSLASDDATEVIHRVLDSTEENGAIELAEIFISAGWNPSLKNSAGETAIHVAARNGYISAVKFFLSQNVPLPSDVLLAAVLSIQRWHSESTCVHLNRFLIREGAHVNVTAPNGDTPLHLAIQNFTPESVGHITHDAQRRSWELVEILLNCGSDSSARNMKGQTAIDLVEAKGHFFKENFLRLVRNSHVHCLRSQPHSTVP